MGCQKTLDPQCSAPENLGDPKFLLNSSGQSQECPVRTALQTDTRIMVKMCNMFRATSAYIEEKKTKETESTDTPQHSACSESTEVFVTERAFEELAKSAKYGQSLQTCTLVRICGHWSNFDNPGSWHASKPAAWYITRWNRTDGGEVIEVSVSLK